MKADQGKELDLRYMRRLASAAESRAAARIRALSRRQWRDPRDIRPSPPAARHGRRHSLTCMVRLQVSGPWRFLQVAHMRASRE